MPTAAYERTRTCVVCETDFAPKAPTQRYCSPECRNRRPRERVDSIGTCAHCGESFTYEARHASRFCGKACAQKHWWSQQPPKPEPYRLSITRWQGRPCRVCASLAWTTYCSDRCCQQYGEYGEGLKQPLTCAECGTTWLRWKRLRRWRYCSDECQRRAVKRVTKRTRRARLKTAQVEPVDLLAVANRDGWRCHICKRKVTRQTWSLDHLVPLSYGGEHSYTNTALAHHRCNTVRSNTGAAQLRLAA
jgi:hypothetical protein